MFRPPLAALMISAAVLAASPAAAQFGDLFRDPPPRPPANVPSRAPLDVLRPDEPPAQPLPAPMNLPPSSRPGSGAIQSQPLPPPPGSISPAAPEIRRSQDPDPRAPAQQTAPAQTLPGLPPGVRQPRGTAAPSNTGPQPGDEVVVEPPAQKITNPQAVFSGLDKITGRIISFDVAINETVQFGALQVTPRACYTRPPTETPNTDTFVEVDEMTLQGETRRIFTGWMFAASPGLHAVEHPVYDVWLTDCKGGASSVAEAPPEAPKPPVRAQQPQQAPRPQQPPPARPPAQQPSFFPPPLSR
ncbi:MAG: DUF2155 domain-containing protein [Hyphomicrobiales bacterium]